MIKVKIVQLLNSIEPLRKIGEQELNGVEAYKISKILSAIEPEIELCSKTRKKLIEECGQRNEKGQLIIQNNNIKIKLDQIEYFNKHLEEMNNLQIELNINKLNLSNLKNIKISAKDLIILNWLLQEKIAPP